MQASSKVPNEVLGNTKDPIHTMKFEYCGGWGYRKHAIAAIQLIEQQTPNIFQYTLYMDPARSGRLEVTVYPFQTTDQGEGGVIVHSKAASKTYISADNEGFLTKVAEAISKWVSTPLAEEIIPVWIGLSQVLVGWPSLQLMLIL